MKLSRASAYALHGLVYLARHNGTTVVPSHDVARAIGAPEKFLLKILRPLGSARLLHSLKGPNGGYRLARPAKDITMLQIVEAVDGPLRAEAPQASEHGAALDKRLQAVCEDAARLVRPVLEGISLASLAAGTTKKSKATKSKRR
jgi:Rrf2 family protein